MEALAEVIANTTRGVKPIRPALRVVDGLPSQQTFDSITRAFCIRRIQFLSRSYGLAWLVDQHQLNAPGLESMRDTDLSTLLKEMERARECMANGIPLEDAGIIQDTSGRIDELLDGDSAWQ